MLNNDNEILQKRAIAMAVETSEISTETNYIEIIAFSLAGETYSIESEYVREVFHMKDFTYLPGVPDHIFGIINVRGQIMPVVDLKVFFNLPVTGFGELNKVIILKNKLMEFGILCDMVLHTQKLPEKEIMGVPATLSGIGEKYLKGVTKEHLIMLNAETIMSSENLIVSDSLS